MTWLALVLTAAASAAIRGDNHPLIALLANSAPLRQGVAVELKTLTKTGKVTDVSRPQAQLALSLVRHREALPPGAVSELLGPETAKALVEASAGAAALAEIDAELDPRDPESMERFMSRTASLYDKASLALSGADVVRAGRSSGGTSALQPTTRFVPKEAVVPAPGKGLGPEVRIERGSVRGLPAVRVTMADGSVVTTVEVGRAKYWSEARKMAQALGEGWDLPGQLEYMWLVMSAALEVAVVVDERTKSALHPMWVRLPLEEQNAILARDNVLMGMQDGKGTEFTGMVADPAVYRKQLAEVNAKLERGEFEPSRQALLDAQAVLGRLAARLEDGYPVHAVSSLERPRRP